MEEDNKMVMFGPQNEKDLKRQYPELGKEKEFSDLTVGELLFVWWYANPTSPLRTDTNMSEKERVGHAYEKSFKNAKPDEERKRNYYSLSFPDRVKLANDRMRKYNPTVRIRSRIMVEKILANLEKLVDMNMEDFIVKDKDGNPEINWTGRNSYVTSVKNISETLPSLIRQVEEGFGITDVKEGETGSKAIHRFHSTNIDK